MVSNRNGTYIFTGTTKDKDLADRLERHLDENEDLKEAYFVREAVREKLQNEA